MRAKAIEVSEWVNRDPDYVLDVFDKRVQLIYAFQMLCPGCVYHSIPQAIRLTRIFEKEPSLQIVGLHTVFENHHAMESTALDVFAREWRLPFAVGVDSFQDGRFFPRSMHDYQLLGTPSTIIIDHKGEVLLCRFGYMKEEALTNLINHLINAVRES